MGKGHTPSPFSNAFHNATLNSLRYNTSIAGSVVTVVFGEARLNVNIIDGFGFKSSKGGGKGGKGGGAAGKKGGSQTTYTVNVAFAICQGPVGFGDLVWSNGGRATGGPGGVHLNGYEGADGQATDAVFESKSGHSPVLGYSGTCYVTGTPMQLGNAPAVPNIQFEILGTGTGIATGSYTWNANPSYIAKAMLSDARWGAGFPVENIDTVSFGDWQNYCQAAYLLMSYVMDRQQPTARWLEEIADLSVSAIVWSGSQLKIIPYGDTALDQNDATWTPNLTWQYSLTNDDFLPWGDNLQGGRQGETDPVIISRKDPAEMTNWLGLEYLDRNNAYNNQLVSVFDQAAIDEFGLKQEASMQAHCFTDSATAQAAGQLILQRKCYVRNTYKFRLPWKFALLEPMDIVLLTDATLGLDGAAVRLTKIEEDDNGALTCTAEEIPGVTP